MVVLCCDEAVLWLCCDEVVLCCDDVVVWLFCSVGFHLSVGSVVVCVVLSSFVHLVLCVY